MDKKIKFKRWNCCPWFGQYSNGRVAIRLMEIETGEQIAVATVNVPERSLQDDEVIIKDFSENEGMLPALIDAGIVEPTGLTVQTGWTESPICKLLITDSKG